MNSGHTAVGNVCYTGDRHYLVGQCFDDDCSVVGPAVIDESFSWPGDTRRAVAAVSSSDRR